MLIVKSLITALLITACNLPEGYNLADHILDPEQMLPADMIRESIDTKLPTRTTSIQTVE